MSVAQVEKSFVEEVEDAEAVEHVHGPGCNHSHDDHEAVHDRQGRLVSNRNERKARKELIKLGLKPMPGIHRVTFKRGRMIFAIADPEVYKNPAGEGWIVFGEARVEDPSMQAQLMAAQNMARNVAQTMQDRKQPNAADSDEKAPELANVAEEDDETVDATGLAESDIKIVMEQANVSRNTAIKALREHDNDVVNTIMELSM